MDNFLLWISLQLDDRKAKSWLKEISHAPNSLHESVGMKRLIGHHTCKLIINSNFRRSISLNSRLDSSNKEGTYHPFCGFCIRRAAWATALPGNQEDTQRSCQHPPLPHLLSFLVVFLASIVGCHAYLVILVSFLLLSIAVFFSVLLMFTDTLGSLFGYR